MGNSPDDSVIDIVRMIGDTSKDLKKIEIYKKVIFWTFDRKQYQKCKWWKKTAAKGIGDKLTIRNANTIKKILK